MASEHLWIAPGDIETDISGRVQLPKPGEDGFRLHSQAVEGSVGSSDILLDDEDGGFEVVGLNAYRVRETLSEADDPYIFAGHFGRRKESRGPYMTGASRQIFAQVQDANSLLSRYVIREGEEGDRPQETDTARWEWLRGTGIFPSESDFDDSLFIVEPTGVTLSAANLQDYTAQQIIDDMAQQSGLNYYVYFDGVEEKYYVIYAPDSGTHLTSALRFSNVEEDADGDTTFYAGLDWELDISPERLASTVIVRYANGSTGETDDDTAAEFSRVDRVMDANLVKTESVALSRAIKYLSELDDEEFELTGSVFLPASKASQFRAGMRVLMKASHLTGLSDFTWVRLHEVTITSISADPTLSYALAFTGTLSPSTTISCSGIIVDLALDLSTEQTDDFEPLTGVAITDPGGDYLALAFLLASQDDTCIAGPSTNGGLTTDSPWTFIDGFKTELNTNCDHTFGGAAYRSNATGTPVWNWSPGGSAQSWQQGSLIIPTAATAPVQVADPVGIDNRDIEFPSPPTPGNLIIAFTVDQPAGGTQASGTLVGFNFIGQLEAGGDKFLYVFCRCVQEGDPDTFDLWDGRSGGGGSHWNFGFEVELS